MTPTHTALMGAGHAYHAWDTKSIQAPCGAEKRRYRDGRRPRANHLRPFREEDVTCSRCRKALGIEVRP